MAVIKPTKANITSAATQGVCKTEFDILIDYINSLTGANGIERATTLPIAEGGTGATTAAEALAALGAVQNAWMPGKPVSVGTVIYPNVYGVNIKARCTGAGTTGATEPTWGAVGSTVSDNGVTWLVISADDKLVGEIVVTASAVSSVTFSGLDSNNAKGYTLVMDIINPTNNYLGINLYANGDTTAANYVSQGIFNNNGSPGSWNAPSGQVAVIRGTEYLGKAKIGVDVSCINGNFIALASFVTGAYTGTGGCWSLSTNQNITSLTINSSIADWIGVGSTFRLYRRF